MARAAGGRGLQRQCVRPARHIDPGLHAPRQPEQRRQRVERDRSAPKRRHVRRARSVAARAPRERRLRQRETCRCGPAPIASRALAAASGAPSASRRASACAGGVNGTSRVAPWKRPATGFQPRPAVVVAALARGRPSARAGRRPPARRPAPRPGSRSTPRRPLPRPRRSGATPGTRRARRRRWASRSTPTAGRVPDGGPGARPCQYETR